VSEQNNGKNFSQIDGWTTGSIQPFERVELHCHTNMSMMDGISDVGDIIRQAKAWGMPAVAITDHGGVQAFPEASRVLEKDDPFKVIYGMEGYLVDDMRPVVENLNPDFNFSLDGPWVVVDLEITGLSPVGSRIIQFDAVRVEQGIITDRFYSLVNPGELIPPEIVSITNIDDSMVQDAPGIDEVLPEFIKFCHGAALAAHNASVEHSFISWNAEHIGQEFCPVFLDTMLLAQPFFPQLDDYHLETVAKELQISPERPQEDRTEVVVVAEVLIAFLNLLKNQGIRSINEVNGFSLERAYNREEFIKKQRTYHVTLLAKNETGLRNLYHLVSMSQTQYFENLPRIPKSLLYQYRDGLLVGSACSDGEVYKAVLYGLAASELNRIMDLYDYLEIQPLANQGYLLNYEILGIRGEETLRELNRRIVCLGEQFGKPVCATGDVHFLKQEDGIYRRILYKYCEVTPDDNQDQYYFHTTEEMMEEFAYLGKDKAKEVVIDNPRKIAELCERISPLRSQGAGLTFDKSLSGKEQGTLFETIEKAVRSQNLRFALTVPAYYENTAYKILKRLFGDEQVFCVGEIMTIDEEMANKCVERYYYDHWTFPIDYRKELIHGLMGILRGTIRCPGTFLVLPRNDSIDDYTPIEEDHFGDNSCFITQFDYDSISSEFIRIDLSDL